MSSFCRCQERDFPARGPAIEKARAPYIDSLRL